ncbi:MAG TPA: carbohydrate porin [Rhizomicrobium sp.]|nr:carbohydrate porin [Rhizomicrobium sp.]
MDVNLARRMRAFVGAAALAAAALWAGASFADTSAPSDEEYSFHGQLTVVNQYHPAFRSPYRGTNSLDPGSRGDETVTATLSAGFRLWEGGQIYFDPEVDQGFGLSNTTGLAAFPNGQGSKVGSSTPYFRLQQVFFRQEIDLGTDPRWVDSSPNQLGMAQSDENIIITLGKFPTTAVFDTNAYAHDPSSDFLNWTLITSGAYDYAADAWGYTYGTSVEWTEGWWTLRGGFFALSRVPNGRDLQTDFTQFEVVGEAEARQDFFGREGKIKFLAFVNRGNMGSYDDAVRLGALTNAIPDTGLVRKYRSRPGFALNIEQPVTDDLGAFLRASFNNGTLETYEFTDTNRSTAVGLSLQGTAWGRHDDTFAVAAVVNAISDSARSYFAAGGLGVLIGDGQLPHYGTENVIETYYSANVTDWLRATADYQFALHPAYNKDRGPVSIFGLRVRASF